MTPDPVADYFLTSKHILNPSLWTGPSSTKTEMVIKRPHSSCLYNKSKKALVYQAYENKAKHHWCKSPNFN